MAALPAKGNIKIRELERKIPTKAMEGKKPSPNNLDGNAAWRGKKRSDEKTKSANLGGILRLTTRQKNKIDTLSMAPSSPPTSSSSRKDKPFVGEDSASRTLAKSRMPTSRRRRMQLQEKKGNPKFGVASAAATRQTPPLPRKVDHEYTPISKRKIFQIEVTKESIDVARTPKQQSSSDTVNVNIHIKGPDFKGLLAVLILTLTIEEWDIVEVVSRRKKHQTKDVLKKENEDDSSSYLIVAHAPPETRRLDYLERLLMETCEDFISARQHLTTLVNSFMCSVDPTQQGFIKIDNIQESRTGELTMSTTTSPVPGAFRISPDPSHDHGASVGDAFAYGHHPEGAYSSSPRIQDDLPNDNLSTAERDLARNHRRRHVDYETHASSRSPPRRHDLEDRRSTTTDQLLITSNGIETKNVNVPIAAEVVRDDDDMEAAMREKIIMEATTASIVSDEDKGHNKKTRLYLIAVSLCACVLAATVIALALTLTRSEAATALPPAAGNASTLDAILRRGHVRCCVNSAEKDIGKLEMKLCQALNVAIFGGNSTSQVEFVTAPVQERFEILNNRTVDVLMQSVSHTTSRSIEEETTGKPYAFSSPYYYDGLVFGGNPDFVDCADRLDSYFGICRRLVICVEDTTTHHDFLEDRIFPSSLKVVDRFDGVLLENGGCNVIADGISHIAESLDSATGGRGDEFPFGTSNLFTTEPLAIVARYEDMRWINFIETMLQGLLEAESRGITSGDVFGPSEIPAVPYFDPMFPKQLLSPVIGSIGNFGEITQVAELPRVGLNRLARPRDNNCQNGDHGLIHGLPFGRPLSPDSFDLFNDSYVDDLTQKARFRCGILEDDNPGEDSALFHIELCKAISAVLYDGSIDQFDVVSFAPLRPTAGNVSLSNNSTKEWHDRLVNLEADIVLGVGSNGLPLLGQTLPKLFLSRPYLFKQSSEPVVFATGGLNYQGYAWFVLVQWILNSMILAEENLISQTNIDAVPNDVLLFGPKLDEKFHTIIETVGNYGEVYDRTVQSPRSGCNRLNSAPHGPQQFPFLFEGL